MRLIDADELMKKFYDIEFNAKYELFGVSRDLALEGLKHIKKALKGMPTIDPVKHGHWILIYEMPRGDYFRCSECNHDVFLKYGRKVSDDYLYCSGCGARMDGEENDSIRV